MLARIVRRMTGSNLLGTIAGFLLAIDGMAIVMSRTALLDGVLAFLVLAAFGALLLDRDRTRRLWPKHSLRPWRWAAAVALGLACGVKWSGLWFVVAFGLLTVFWDLGMRRERGRTPTPSSAPCCAMPCRPPWSSCRWPCSRIWPPGTGGSPAPDTCGRGPPTTAATPASQAALRSLAHYHAEAYRFHTGLTTAHSYQANAWGWPVLARPTSFHYESEGLDCRADSCAQEVIALGNPVIWWAAVLALFHQVWRWAAVRDWRAGAVLCGFLAGWAPWLLFQERTVFALLLDRLPAVHDHGTDHVAGHDPGHRIRHPGAPRQRGHRSDHASC